MYLFLYILFHLCFILLCYFFVLFKLFLYCLLLFCLFVFVTAFAIQMCRFGHASKVNWNWERGIEREDMKRGGLEGERFLRQWDMAHVINSGWVDSLPRHLLRSPPLAGVGVSTLVPPHTQNNRQRNSTACLSAHNAPNLFERKNKWREGGGCRVVGNNGLSGRSTDTS